MYSFMAGMATALIVAAVAVLEPEMAETPQVAAYIAAWFWNRKDLNRFADSGDFITLTRRINGGLNGLANRKSYWARAKEALGA